MSDGDYIIIDYSTSDLYGVRTGDTLTLDLDGIEHEYTVGGIVRHNFFGGRYVIVSRPSLEECFGVYADTVVLVTSEDTSLVAERVRTTFADRNYYAVPAIEAYKWGDVPEIPFHFPDSAKGRGAVRPL